jgi:hypothetical protein
MSRNTVAAAGGVVIFVVVVALGFRELGSPRTQRLKQIDSRTLQMMSQLAQQNFQRYANDKKLPADLNNVRLPKKNPANGEEIRYRVKTGSEYELCARFATDSREDRGDAGSEDKFWEHPEGDYCFSIDAAGSVPSVPYNY